MQLFCISSLLPYVWYVLQIYNERFFKVMVEVEYGTAPPPKTRFTDITSFNSIRMKLEQDNKELRERVDDLEKRLRAIEKSSSSYVLAYPTDY